MVELLSDRADDRGCGIEAAKGRRKGKASQIERPEEISAAIQRAKRATEEGRAALLEFITSEETAYSRPE